MVVRESKTKVEGVVRKEDRLESLPSVLSSINMKREERMTAMAHLTDVFTRRRNLGSRKRKLWTMIC